MTDKQKQFLQLRADGLSFDKIAKELNASKPTLIQWSRLFANELNDLKFQSLADLKEQYKYSKRAKYEQLLKHLQKIDAAIDNINLENASIKDLLTVRNNITDQLERIEQKTTFINSGLMVSDGIGGKEQIAIKLCEVE